MKQTCPGMPVSGELRWDRVAVGAAETRTRAFAQTPSTGLVGGQVSLRRQYPSIDLDPQRPRPSGGCP